MAQWIDFKQLRAHLQIADVLAHHGIELKIRGDQASGFCPLPGHADSSSPSFSAHLKKNCFHCFGCQRHGNALDLEILLQQRDPSDSRVVREVALALAERFGLCIGSRRGNASRLQRNTPSKVNPAPAAPRVTCATPVELSDSDRPIDAGTIINPPLEFELQNLDRSHPYLRSRGLTDETIAHFGLGFCSKGMLKDRIAIPLHDETGRLIAYAGRLIDDSKISSENPKYLFPGRREKGGKVIEFRKSMLLYNAHRIGRQLSNLVIVEGFSSVWWLWQNGVTNVVALMGASASEWQLSRIAQLVDPSGAILLLPDGDEAGTRLVRTLLPQLSARRLSRWLMLLPDEQPTDLSAEAIRAILAR